MEARARSEAGKVPVYLGDYLIELGFITASQLREALALQQAENLRLGECAVSLGFMAPQAVQQVTLAQRSQDSPFGEVAVKLGHLTAKQVARALDHQRTTHVRLGEALVRVGAITPNLLASVVADFESSSMPNSAPPVVGSLAVATEELVTCVQRMLMRVGQIRTKLVPWEPLDPGPCPPYITTGIEFTGQERLGLWLSLPPSLSIQLANALLPDFGPPELIAHDALDELVNMVCAYAVNALKSRGIDVRNSPPRRAVPLFSGAAGFLVVLPVPNEPPVEVRVMR
ncbi:MAG: hypothetical protein KA712_16250 [Myxococcales bacterium]|nr:hypothetical protein [Myxococcales bacterium]